ncbi:ABC transporter substrate-binding protein [Micromonospora azadirachtae]|uniref:ABC transporter substrate-binding protein n=1 Tax=Micromonospora azadirachtae TaxID=1970735 RepID=A0ABW2ZX04_9ACTN
MRAPTAVRRALALVAALIMTSALMACAGASASEDQHPAAADGYPRTIKTDVGDVTIKSRPERIVAASTNAAEIALSLVGPDRLIGVPEWPTDDRHSPFAAEARQVGHTVGTVADDPEQILALNPDLVLITLAHDTERDALKVLQQAGVPTLVLSHFPSVTNDALADISLIGEALGAEQKATELVGQLRGRLDAVKQAVAGSTVKPRVVFISMWLDNGPYVTGPGTINHDLITLAGAANAIEDAGFDSSGYLDPEQLVKAAPTHIVTLDSAGVGLDKLTKGFLKNPALANVPAIANDRILVLPDRMFSPAQAGIEGLELMAKWLHDPNATREVQ